MIGLTRTPTVTPAAGSPPRGDSMSMGDKIKNATGDTAGKAKEGAGKATDNEELEARGQGDQARAAAKKAGENVKDAAKDVFNG